MSSVGFRGRSTCSNTKPTATSWLRGRRTFSTTYVGDGMFEFIPLIGGPAGLTHPEGDDGVELRFVGDQPEDALEFWKALEVISGEDQGEDRYAGDWLCAPGLLGEPGFMDIDLSAPGTWSLVPTP